MDNKEFGTLLSSIDVAHGMRFAVQQGVFDISSSGETSMEIAKRTGLHPNKTDALMRAGLFYGYLQQDGEKIFLTEPGRNFIDGGGTNEHLERYTELIHGVQLAVRQNLFEIPHSGETMDQIIRRTDTDRGMAASLLRIGLQLQALEQDRDGGRYFLTKEGRAFLTKDSPFTMAGIFAWWPLDYDSFKGPFDGSHPPIFSADKEMIKLMVGGMHQKSAWLAHNWPSQVDLSQVQTLLDVGAGSGIHAIEACGKFSNLNGIALDLPWNCSTISEFIELYRMGGKVSPYPADMFKTTWPKADVIVMCDIIHDWSNAKVRELLAKAHVSLPTDGRIIILENLFNEKRTGPFSAVAFNLVVVKMLEDGGQRTGKQIEHLLDEADFGEISLTPTVSGVTLIQAFKR